MSPVIDAAVNAAFVFHDKGLERAEEQDADVVTQEVEDRQHQQVACPDDAQQIQKTENRIKRKPYKNDFPGAYILLLHIMQQLKLLVIIDRLILSLPHLAESH